MLSVTILVRNGQRRIFEVLKALKDFPEVILVDTGSNDNTLNLARPFSNVKIFEKIFKGFGPSHNEAAELATHDWILSIDADEIVSPELAKEILEYQLDPQCVYNLIFYNYFRGKRIRGCGWNPESHVRLYHRKATQFSEEKVHEGVITQGFEVITLKSPIYHHSYETISDFLTKMERYSTLFAEQYATKKRSSFSKAILHGFWAFFRSYFLKKGFLDGIEGWIISAYNGHTAYYKYLKLNEANAHRTHVSQDRER